MKHNAVAFNAQRGRLGARKSLFSPPRFAYFPVVKTMKAVVKAKPEPGLWLEEVPIPQVGRDDVLIRVLKASICGTDVHIYNWDEIGRAHV